MKNLNKYVIPLLLCILLISVFYTRKAIGSSTNLQQASATLTSTSQPATTIPQANVTPTGTPKSPAEILRKSALAMQQLKTLHITIVHTKEQSITPSSTVAGSSEAGDVTLITNYDGDVQLPDQASFKATINSKSSSSPSQTVLKIAGIVKGIQLYAQNLQGSNPQWAQVDPPYSVTPTIRNSLTVLPVNDYINMLAILLPFAQDSDITDHGSDNTQGTNLHHFTVKLGANALEDLIRLHTADDAYSPEAQVLNSATFDVWIDDSTSYIHNISLNVNTTEDYSKIKAYIDESDDDGSGPSTPSALPRPSASSTPVLLTGTGKLAVTLTTAFSKFNQAVSIAAPANAVVNDQNPQSLVPSKAVP